jgi:hypothetical protein
VHAESGCCVCVCVQGPDIWVGSPRYYLRNLYVVGWARYVSREWGGDRLQKVMISSLLIPKKTKERKPLCIRTRTLFNAVSVYASTCRSLSCIQQRLYRLPPCIAHSEGNENKNKNKLLSSSVSVGMEGEGVHEHTNDAPSQQRPIQRLRKQAFNVRECLVNAIIAHSDTRSGDRVDPVRDGHPVAVPIVVVSRRGVVGSRRRRGNSRRSGRGRVVRLGRGGVRSIRRGCVSGLVGVVMPLKGYSVRPAMSAPLLAVV